MERFNPYNEERRDSVKKKEFLKSTLNFENEIKHAEIKALEKPLQNLLDQLREKIDGGDYHTIIGDDASGRIPTLILRRLFNEVYSKKNLPPIKTFFIAGSQKISDSDKIKKTDRIFDYLKSINISAGEPRKKVLIVTEVIETGKGLLPLTDALNKLEIDYEIASVGDETWWHDRKVELGITYYGIKDTPAIFETPELAGVKKDYHNLISDVAKTEHTDDAREDVKILSEQLINWYNNDSQN